MGSIKVSRRGVEYDEGIVREIVPTIDYGRMPVPQPINPPLEIRKGFGTLCQGERAEKYFCLIKSGQTSPFRAGSHHYVGFHGDRFIKPSFTRLLSSPHKGG